VACDGFVVLRGIKNNALPGVIRGLKIFIGFGQNQCFVFCYLI